MVVISNRVIMELQNGSNFVYSSMQIAHVNGIIIIEGIINTLLKRPRMGIIGTFAPTDLF